MTVVQEAEIQFLVLLHQQVAVAVATVHQKKMVEAERALQDQVIHLLLVLTKEIQEGQEILMVAVAELTQVVALQVVQQEPMEELEDQVLYQVQM
jgi:hypothetical protein